MAQAFIGPAPANYEVNHKNGIKEDNRVENLEWVTQEENSTHAHEQNLYLKKDNHSRFIDRIVILDMNNNYVKTVCGKHELQENGFLSQAYLVANKKAKKHRNHKFMWEKEYLNTLVQCQSTFNIWK